MGFRQAAVLSSVGFVLGTLFVCFTVDHKLLFGEVSEETVEDGFFFYTTFYNSTPAIKTLLHTIVGIGLGGLIGKLHKWDESAVFFDGTSLAAYVFAIALYLSVTVPALRTIVDPVVGVDTREDRIEAMRILAAGNTIIVFLLGAILCLQGYLNGTTLNDAIVSSGIFSFLITPGLRDKRGHILIGTSPDNFLQGGQEYARRVEAQELAKAEAASVSSDKKEQ